MDFRSRKMIMSQDLNGAGTLFGGRAMEWIDEESAIFAICKIGSPRVVTKYISKIDFKAPAHMGDIIEIGTSMVKIGTTSVTVRCTIRNKTTKQEIVIVDEIVFVRIDENGKAVPHGLQP